MINLGGFKPFSTIDYPCKLSAVIFCQGCSWRCCYCHNQHLKPIKHNSQVHAVTWSKIIESLKQREILIDAVVFSGGEPLLQKKLVNAIKEIRKQTSLCVGLHTTGVSFEQFKNVLPHVDWVGFDIKYLFNYYKSITKVAGSGQQPFKSAKKLLASNVLHEFRTTLAPSLRDDKSSLIKLAQSLSDMGVKNYVIQRCREKDNNGNYVTDNRDYDDLLSQVQSLIPNTILR